MLVVVHQKDRYRRAHGKIADKRNNKGCRRAGFEASGAKTQRIAEVRKPRSQNGRKQTKIAAALLGDRFSPQ